LGSGLGIRRSADCVSDSDMNEPGTMSIRESAETGRMRRSSNAKLLVARAPVINARLLDATMVTFSVPCRRFDFQRDSFVVE
jgi:hypothetical protein